MNAPSDDIDVIKGIEDWFSARCDDDWEHSYGLSIETIDNPGWQVEIDLLDTVWENIDRPFARVERSEFDWIQIEIREGKFIGSGGRKNLTEILRQFLVIVNPSTHP